MYRHFSDMCWPAPSTLMDTVERALRDGKAAPCDLLMAASIIAAYRQMIADPEWKRRMVIRELRKVEDAV